MKSKATLTKKKKKKSKATGNISSLPDDLLKATGNISSLPDDLLLKILSSLCINEVVATSVLSKRWRTLWKHVTKLIYDDSSCSFEQFRGFVSKSLPFSEARFLQSFHLKFYPNVPVADYIDLLAHLSNLEVRIETIYGSLTLPRSLFCEFWTLETLILERLCLMDVPSTQDPLRLRFLKTLHLLSVRFSDDESVQRLLSICPVLENLVVRRTTYVNVTMFIINVPTFKSLSIYYNSWAISQPVGDHGFVINAPSLRYLNIRDYSSNVLRFGRHMPELVKATVDIAVWWDLLNSIFQDAPRLQVLKMKLLKPRVLLHSMDRWNQPCSVPECLVSHLEIFEWRHYTGTKQENKLAKYILKNANCLKMATFSSVCGKKKRIFKKLEYAYRGSEACQLVFV